MWKIQFYKKYFVLVEGEHWENSPNAEQITWWSHIHTIIAQIVATMPMWVILLPKLINFNQKILTYLYPCNDN